MKVWFSLMICYHQFYKENYSLRTANAFSFYIYKPYRHLIKGNN